MQGEGTMGEKVVVVDASLIAASLIPEQGSEKVIVLLQEWEANEVKLLAPSIFYDEVINVLYKKVIAGFFQAEDGERLISDLCGLGIKVYCEQSEKSLQEMFRMAGIYKHNSVYDFAYVQLAKEQNAEFWTLDKDLYTRAKKEITGAHILRTH